MNYSLNLFTLKAGVLQIFGSNLCSGFMVVVSKLRVKPPDVVQQHACQNDFHVSLFSLNQQDSYREVSFM
jgi:hypothetical protein